MPFKIKLSNRNKAGIAAFLGALGGGGLLALLGQTIWAWGVCLALVAVSIIIFFHGRVRRMVFIAIVCVCILGVAGTVTAIDMAISSSVAKPRPIDTVVTVHLYTYFDNTLAAPIDFTLQPTTTVKTIVTMQLQKSGLPNYPTPMGPVNLYWYEDMKFITDQSKTVHELGISPGDHLLLTDITDEGKVFALMQFELNKESK